MQRRFRAILTVASLGGLCASVTASVAADSLPSALEAGWKGEPVCALRHQTISHRVLECSFAPGVGHDRHFHPAHFGYALSGGTMRLSDARGDRVAEIATGSSYASNGVE